MPDKIARLVARRDVQVWLLATLVGGVTFFAWLGYGRTLVPTDLSWIFHEDPFTHAMGWEQYRNAPLLQYPVTKNGLYGLEWSSTIVFTDSIPIVALVLRPFSALLPVPFQYLGWWVLLCLVLQAYFAMRLVLLRTDRLRNAVLPAIAFVTTPVLLERMGLQTGVGSHFLLLWGLFLYFSRTDAAHRAWLILLLVTVSVHAYIFVMVGGIWAAHVVACGMRGRLNRRDLVHCGAMLVVVVAWMHALGYFLVGGGAAGSGWRSNFDLLGFLAPSAGARFGLLQSVYDDPWDGSTYLGAGILLLLVVSSIASVVMRMRKRAIGPAAHADVRWLPLVVVVVGALLFAVTNHVTAGNQTLARLPLPRPLEALYETFRGANRMAWPAYYLVLISTVWLALSVWTARLVTIVLAAAMLVQVVDLWDVGANKRQELAVDGMTRELRDPVWTTVATRYQRLVSVPAKHRQGDWPTFAWFAARHGLGSNIGYVSRNNPDTRIAGTRAHLEAIATGKLDAGTVYHFRSDLVFTVAQQALGPEDAAVIADGERLILPGGKRWVTNTLAAPQAAVPRLGETIPFNDENAYGLLVDGWSWTEFWGTWSLGPRSWLILPVPADERIRVTFRWRPINKRNEAQSLRVTIGGQRFTTAFSLSKKDRTHSLEVTTTSRLLDVQIEPAFHVTTPNERTRAIGLVSARVQRASDPEIEDIPIAARGEPILDAPISFVADAPGRTFLHAGWSWGEAWGTWSDDPEPTLALPVPPNERIQVTFDWLATAPPGFQQRVHVIIDGRPVSDVVFASNTEGRSDSFEVTTTRGWIVVRLAVAHPVPQKDERQLGVGLKSVTVRRAPR